MSVAELRVSAAGRRLRVPRSVAEAGAAAAAAVALWWELLPGTGTDMAAAVAHAQFAALRPLATYDLRWYGGFSPQSYSVLAPVVMALVGVRLSAALATLLSAAVFADLAGRFLLRPRVAALTAVGTLMANLIAGRVPFSLGVAAGLCALRLLVRPSRARRAGAAVLAVLSSLLSPLAGLFVGVAAAGLLLAGRRRDGLAVGLAAAAPLLLAFVFGREGVEPMGWEVLVPSVGFAALGAWWGRGAFRTAACVYGVGCLLAFVVPGPVGANADRLALLFGPPLVAGLVPAPRRAMAAVLAVCLAWPGNFLRADLAHARDPAAVTGYYAPLLAELRAVGADGWRVEAVPERNHWDAARLAGSVLLARGWETQLDTRRDALFYRPQLSEQAYFSWLQANSVRFVALSDAPVDWSGRTEAALLAAPPPWLHQVWSNAHWTLWEVTSPTALVTGATVIGIGPSSLIVYTPGPADVLVRVHYSRWLSADSGAVATATPDGWTLLHAPRAGTYRLGSG